MRLSKEYARFNFEINSSVPYIALSGNATRLNISPKQVTSIQEHLIDWNSKYAPYISPNTHTDPVILAVKKAYKIFYSEIQAIKLQLKFNKAITLTSEDYANIRVHKNVTKRSRVPRPVMAPDTEVLYQTHLVAKIFARCPGHKTKKSLPDDVKKIGRKLVVQAVDLDLPLPAMYQSIESIGSTTFNLIFKYEEKGLQAHLITCYINPTGEEGPYSNPLSFLII